MFHLFVLLNNFACKSIFHKCSEKKGKEKQNNKLEFGGRRRCSLEPAAETTALVLAAVAAEAAQGEVTLALFPDMFWHLCERQETRIKCHQHYLLFFLCLREDQATPWGKQHPLKF
ncbi:hypothetical protein AMECASPLE_024561 [Ameca splendens]|uniref:Secreted protein n=1 Tax=Ameca splendens TaxID=208324 RepID=A0ABV0ZZZ2_9TELE